MKLSPSVRIENGSLDADGDRVIDARGSSRGIDIDDSDLHELAARWDQELAALTFPRRKPRSV